MYNIDIFKRFSMVEKGLTRNRGGLRETAEVGQSQRLLAGIYKILVRYFPSSEVDYESSKEILLDIASRLPSSYGLGISSWDFASCERGLSALPSLILRRRTHYQWMTTHVYGVGTTRDSSSEAAEVWFVRPDGSCEGAVTQRRGCEYEFGCGTRLDLSDLRASSEPPCPEDLRELLRALIEIVRPPLASPIIDGKITEITQGCGPKAAAVLRLEEK